MSLVDIYKAYKVPEANAKKGVWYKLSNCGAEFLLAHAGKENTEYFSFLMQALRDLPNNISQEKDREILVKCFAKFIVKDWKNVVKGTTKVPFTYDNCIELLAGLPRVFDEINLFASNYKNFTERDLSSVEQEVSDTAKKSQT